MKIRLGQLKMIIREELSFVNEGRKPKKKSAGPDVSASTKAFGGGSVVKEADVEEGYEGFKKLKGKLSHQKGVKNAGGLAASIGRKKYGAKKFAQLSAAGRKRKASRRKIKKSL